MKKKFWFLVSHSIKKKIRSKWFIIANIVLFIGILAVFNIDRIITYFGGDFTEERQIFVVDETGYSYNLLKAQIENMENILDFNNNVKKQIEKAEDVEGLKTKIQDTDNIIIVLAKDENQYLKASIMSSSSIDSVFYQTLFQALNQVKMQIALEQSGIDSMLYQQVTSNIQIDRVILDENVTDEKEMMNTIMGTVFPTVILPFFILVVFLVQMIGNEINEEKSSRSMEIIISNVSPKTHFFSKVVSANSFIFLQAFLLIFYGVFALILRNLLGGGGAVGEIGTYFNSVVSTLATAGILNQLVLIIPLTLILMILSFITYSLIAGILASMTVSMEDFQQIQTPIIFICLIGYYLSIMAGMFHGSIFIRIFSYIPLFSSLLTPALLVTGQIHIIDAIISILILGISNWLLIRFGLRIYKVGILNYSTDKMWSKILSAARINSKK